jgi:hypothetical protein
VAFHASTLERVLAQLEAVAGGKGRPDFRPCCDLRECIAGGMQSDLGFGKKIIGK